MQWRPLFNRITLPIAVVTLYFLVPVSIDDAPVGSLLGALVGVAAIAAIAAVIVNEARRAERRLEPVHLLLAFELVLVIFSMTYYVLALKYPGEFSGLDTRLDALYFSMTTMSTVGYGDIHASGQSARLLVTLQLGFNLVFVAALVALLQDKVHRGKG
ncbi:potassium channel family protein [Tessaracoccus sp. G1721]